MFLHFLLFFSTFAGPHRLCSGFTNGFALGDYSCLAGLRELYRVLESNPGLASCKASVPTVLLLQPLPVPFKHTYVGRRNRTADRVFALQVASPGAFSSTFSQPCQEWSLSTAYCDPQTNSKVKKKSVLTLINLFLLCFQSSRLIAFSEYLLWTLEAILSILDLLPVLPRKRFPVLNMRKWN